MSSRTYPERPIVGIGVVVWRERRVLLVRRANPPRAGEWSLPGGAQRLGETLTEAARREVMEETGLAIDGIRLVTALDLIERDPDGRVRHHYTLIDLVAEAGAGEPVAGDDAAAVAWFRLDELDGLGLWTKTRQVIAQAAALRGRTEDGHGETDGRGERPPTV